MTGVDPHIVKRVTHRAIAALVALMLAGCVVIPRVMWQRAEENKRRIQQIRIDQTIEEVRTIMGKNPERREARARFDGKIVEMWSYVTDYARRLDTTIIFVDGRVQELRASPWEEKD